MINKDSLVKIVWIVYNSGDKNINVNLIGFVIFVINVVKVNLIIIFVVVFCFDGFVVIIIVRYVVGRLNIMIGKKLVIYVFVVGFFVKKWVRFLVILLYFLNWN